jgi:hypothetical protein
MHPGSYMRRLIIFALTLCAISVKAHATTVIAVSEPTFMIFAADSKVVTPLNGPGYNVCKINVSNNVYWASAGLHSDPSVRLDITAIVNDSMNTTYDLGTRISHFEAAIIPILNDSLNGLLIDHPSLFHKQYDRGDEDVVDIVFGSFENGAPKMYVLSFKPIYDRASKTINIIQTVESPVPGFYAFLGRHEAIEAMISNDPTLREKLAIPRTVRGLIEAEIAGAGEDVGPPISLVIISKEGPHWISKGLCTK